MCILFTVACGARSADADVISRETFVNVYVELRQAQDVATSAEQFDAMKREILERYGIDEDALFRFVAAHGHDIEFMAEVWDTLLARLTPSDSTN